MQEFLLEEGSEDLTLRLEKGDRTYNGKQIIPVIKQFIENRSIFNLSLIHISEPTRPY